jgi:cyclopropane-fatty-acyl-phospholipid synthase
MFEHVGYKNHRKYMRTVKKILKKDGLFFLHTIGNDVSAVCGDPWINRYIFPNGMTPSMSQISKSVEKLFVMEDWENIGVHYDKTLMQWHKRVKRSWKTLMKNYDSRFYRMWSFYLLSCAGLFRARQAQVWQMVFSPKGIKGGYKPVRF